MPGLDDCTGGRQALARPEPVRLGSQPALERLSSAIVVYDERRYRYRRLDCTGTRPEAGPRGYPQLLRPAAAGSAAVISAAADVLVAGAGVLAGIVGTAGGITSLISYPALLAVGVPALTANVANIVALVTCGPGAALASRPELAGWASWVRRWSLAAAAGGTAGAVLLLLTPAGSFSRIVPYLVALGSVALLVQPGVSALRDGHGRGNTVALLAGLLVISAYSGYFGAGSGVLTLALLLFTVDSELARANALKNVIVGIATAISALILILAGPVDWTVVLPLAAGLFTGSLIGPRVARRVPAGILRWLVALVGLGLAAWLWANQA
jgi:uncharacterized protein